MTDNILIIGGGEIGQAVAKLLSVHHQPIIFDREQTRGNTTQSLAELVIGAQIIFLAVPARALPEVLAELGPILDPATTLVGLSKGVTDEGEFVGEVLARALPKQPWALLSGPMLAEEIMAGKRAYALVASADQAVADLVVNLFSQSLLRVKTTNDVRGLNVVGVTKNIYTLGLAIADALALGANSYGVLVAQALLEMTLIITHLGGAEATVWSWAGVGDLVATAGSEHSQNRAVGEGLVANSQSELASEGSLALPLLLPRLDQIKAELPFLVAVAAVMVRQEPSQEEFNKLLQNL